MRNCQSDRVYIFWLHICVKLYFMFFISLEIMIRIYWVYLKIYMWGILWMNLVKFNLITASQLFSSIHIFLIFFFFVNICKGKENPIHLYIVCVCPVVFVIDDMGQKWKRSGIFFGVNHLSFHISFIYCNSISFEK